MKYTLITLKLNRLVLVSIWELVVFAELVELKARQ